VCAGLLICCDQVRGRVGRPGRRDCAHLDERPEEQRRISDDVSARARRLRGQPGERLAQSVQGIRAFLLLLGGGVCTVLGIAAQVEIKSKRWK